MTMSKENNSKKKKRLAQAPLLTCATEGIKLLVKSVCSLSVKQCKNPCSATPTPPPTLSKEFEYAP